MPSVAEANVELEVSHSLRRSYSKTPTSHPKNVGQPSSVGLVIPCGEHIRQHDGLSATTNNLTTFHRCWKCDLCLSNASSRTIEKYVPSLHRFHYRIAQKTSEAYLKNLHTWSTTTTPPPKTAAAAATRSTRARTTRTSTLATTPTTYAAPVQLPPLPVTPLVPVPAPNPPRPPLPTAPQALQSTYASRLRTGATLLMQPILSSASATSTRAATRRGGVINYADPGSGDDLPDAGALDSDDSDFVASGGTRTSIRQSRSRMTTGMNIFNSTTGVSTPTPTHTPRQEKAELDQSYLGMIPPARFIKSKVMVPTAHEYPYV